MKHKCAEKKIPSSFVWLNINKRNFIPVIYFAFYLNLRKWSTNYKPSYLQSTKASLTKLCHLLDDSLNNKKTINVSRLNVQKEMNNIAWQTDKTNCDVTLSYSPPQGLAPVVQRDDSTRDLLDKSLFSG